jgi:hypothetical protein
MSGAAHESMSLQRRIMRQALPNLRRTFVVPDFAVLNSFIYVALLPYLICQLSSAHEVRRLKRA